ncbi:phosphotransferase family protein [Catellatospora methionotrophica]|uniref:phosphotransferase family protein n=1 Tax=Catellatospora methionotrophica TaxID=121620 RepID=UPI0033EF068E
MSGGRRVAEVRELVRAYLPGHGVAVVSALGAGLDNEAFVVDGALVVRFSREPDPVRRAALVEHEARLLAAVAAVCPLPVPEPVFTVPERGCLAYAKLAGVPLAELAGRPARGGPVAAVLGAMLAALHAAPAERWAGLVDVDDQPMEQWLSEAAELGESVAGHVPARYRRAVASFFDTPPPPRGWDLVFSHNDLGAEHVLVDPAVWMVTGVIDWSDAALVDPAYDFGLIYRDLGPGALRAALDRYPGAVEGLGERAVFYARCSVFEDLAYGVDTGREGYARRALEAMAWLFPA